MPRGVEGGAVKRQPADRLLWKMRTAAGPGDRIADAGTGDGIGQVLGIAGGRAVDAVGVEEVPVLVGGIAAGKEDVEVRVRAPRTALAAGTGVARPAEGLAGRHVLADQAEIDLLVVGAPVTRVETAVCRVLGAAGGEEMNAVGGQPLGTGRRVGEGLGPGGVAVVAGAVSQVHVDGAVGIGPAAGVVADDHRVARPGVPADEDDLAGRGGADGERLLVVAAEVGGVMPAAGVVEPDTSAPDGGIGEGEGEDRVVARQGREPDVVRRAVAVDRPVVDHGGVGARRAAASGAAGAVRGGGADAVVVGAAGDDLVGALVAAGSGRHRHGDQALAPAGQLVPAGHEALPVAGPEGGRAAAGAPDAGVAPAAAVVVIGVHVDEVQAAAGELGLIAGQAGGVEAGEQVMVAVARAPQRQEPQPAVVAVGPEPDRPHAAGGEALVEAGQGRPVEVQRQLLPVLAGPPGAQEAALPPVDVGVDVDQAKAARGELAVAGREGSRVEAARQLLGVAALAPGAGIEAAGALNVGAHGHQPETLLAGLPPLLLEFLPARQRPQQVGVVAAAEHAGEDGLGAQGSGDGERQRQRQRM